MFLHSIDATMYVCMYNCAYCLQDFFMKYIENLTNLPLVGTLICWGRSVTIHNTNAAFRR